MIAKELCAKGGHSTHISPSHPHAHTHILITAHTHAHANTHIHLYTHAHTIPACTRHSYTHPCTHTLYTHADFLALLHHAHSGWLLNHRYGLQTEHHIWQAMPLRLFQFEIHHLLLEIQRFWQWHKRISYGKPWWPCLNPLPPTPTPTHTHTTCTCKDRGACSLLPAILYSVDMVCGITKRFQKHIWKPKTCAPESWPCPNDIHKVLTLP